MVQERANTLSRYESWHGNCWLESGTQMVESRTAFRLRQFLSRCGLLGSPLLEGRVDLV